MKSATIVRVKIKLKESESMQKEITVLWGSFLAAPLIYIGISTFLAQQMQPIGSVFMPLLIGLGCVSLGLAVVSVFLRLRLVLEPLQKGLEKKASADGVNPIRTPLIITWALVETIAVFGLILAILGAKMVYCLPFCGVSFFLFFFHHPFIFHRH